MINEHEHDHHEGDRPEQRRESYEDHRSHAEHEPEQRREDQAHHLPLNDPSLYINRELSWLDFNERVLQLGEDESIPLLERVKFCAIYTTNLDEYYMVRVAGLHDQIDAGVENPSQDGRTPTETIAGIRDRVLALGTRLSDCFEGHLRPALSEQSVSVVRFEQLDEEQRAYLAQHFRRVIFPALTPLAVAPGRPFPYISNLSLSLAVLVRDPAGGETVFARVKVPTEILPRFVAVRSAGPTVTAGESPGGEAAGAQSPSVADASPPGSRDAPPIGGHSPSHTGGHSPSHTGGHGPQLTSITLVPLEDVIAHHLDALFPGMEIVDYDVFRVTRDADLEVSDDAADLLQAVEDELRRRRFGEIVRVEIGTSCSERLREELVGLLGVREDEVYPVAGLLDMGALWQIVKLPGMPELRNAPYAPVTHPRLLRHEGERPDVFAAMREGDVLVHHPYDSFSTSVERFVEQAVADPNVLAIKQTVYRTSDDSPLVPALIRAAERGKQAVCLVELQARFDERTNIHWAKALEQSGVHVVYGHPALKTHAKCVLVVRREGDGVRNYVHIGTGNYHSATARLYTDFGLFTTDEAIGADVAELFNYLTGFGRPSGYRKVLVAPSYLRNAILDEIAQAIAAHSPPSPARITLKLNSLVDRACIEALYLASRAGVRVDLNVRGICCLRPGLPGISENIRAVSVVGRFLEHSRVYAFDYDGAQKVYISSADLMPRNLDNRVELAVPIEDPALRAEVLEAVELCLSDNHNAWDLGSDGVWTRRVAPSPEQTINAQELLMRRHTARSGEA